MESLRKLYDSVFNILFSKYIETNFRYFWMNVSAIFVFSSFYVVLNDYNLKLTSQTLPDEDRIGEMMNLAPSVMNLHPNFASNRTTSIPRLSV